MDGADGLAAWLDAGRKLRLADPERYRKTLALARAYLSLYDREAESSDVVASRLIEILGGNPKASA